MKRILATAAFALGLSAPPAAGQDAGFQMLATMRPFIDIASPQHWEPVAEALRKDGLWRIFEAQGFELTPWTIHAVVVDLIAGGDLELLVSFREGCGNSGCWTYLLEVRNGTWQVIIYTVLPDAFIVWRNAGETHSVISGYRHGLFWNGRAWVQFCTDTKYCG